MNKYHAKRATFGDEVFDSTVERDYHLLLLAREQQGEIESFRRQPHYVLVESFAKNGRKHQAITYTADFEVTYPDGRVEAVDVKGGVETEAFSIRARLFEWRYPELTLVRMRYVQKFGGWITTEEYNRKKREERRAEKRVAERAVSYAHRRY